jgi:hypothetical protein
MPTPLVSVVSPSIFRSLLSVFTANYRKKKNGEKQIKNKKFFVCKVHVRGRGERIRGRWEG